LGLTIARQLVEAHGGTLTASAVAGGGARFTIALPVTAPATP
jgi:two-component system sensor histidine kinase BaeS